MAAIPANWQRLELETLIEASASSLDRDDFTYKAIREGYAREDTGFAYMFGGIVEGRFVVDWQDWTESAAGYGGRPPKGKWHIGLRPGREDPVEEYSGLPWEEVSSRFSAWLSYLEREVRATEQLRRGWVRLPLLLPPVSAPDDDVPPDVDVLELVLLEAGNEFTEIVEEEYATANDLAELRQWFEREFSEVRDELRRQSKKGFRRTLFGFGANLAIKFGPDVWSRMMPHFEELIRVLDGLPRIGQ